MRCAFRHTSASGIFDLRAAVELAVRLRDAAAKGDIRDGLTITKSRMKFDRQIVAIALTNGARVLYTDDDGVRKFAEGCGLSVKRTSDLAIPAVQQELFEGKATPPADVPASGAPHNRNRRRRRRPNSRKKAATQSGGGGGPSCTRTGPESPLQAVPHPRGSAKPM